GRSTAAPSQCRPRWLASLRPRKAPARPAARRPRTPRARRPGPARRSHEQATAEPCCRLRVSVRADDLLQLWQQARRRDHDELLVLTGEVVDGGVRDAGSEPARVARFVEVVPNRRLPLRVLPELLPRLRHHPVYEYLRGVRMWRPVHQANVREPARYGRG